MRPMRDLSAIAAAMLIIAPFPATAWPPDADTGKPIQTPAKGADHMSNIDPTRNASITRLNPPTLWNADGLSQISIVESGRLAFLSGQVACRHDTQKVPDDLAQQMELASDNLDKALKALDATSEDIVMIRFYVANGTSERLGQVWPVLERRFGKVRPSVTALGVTALATPDLQVEVEAVVRLP